MLKRVLPRKKGIDQFVLNYKGFEFLITIKDGKACAQCQGIPNNIKLFRTQDKQIVAPDGIEYTKHGGMCGIMYFKPFSGEWTHPVIPIIQYQKLPQYKEDIVLWKTVFKGDDYVIFKDSSAWCWTKNILVADLKRRIAYCRRKNMRVRKMYRTSACRVMSRIKKCSVPKLDIKDALITDGSSAGTAIVKRS